MAGVKGLKGICVAVWLLTARRPCPLSGEYPRDSLPIRSDRRASFIPRAATPCHLLRGPGEVISRRRAALPRSLGGFVSAQARRVQLLRIILCNYLTFPSRYDYMVMKAGRAGESEEGVGRGKKGRGVKCTTCYSHLKLQSTSRGGPLTPAPTTC